VYRECTVSVPKIAGSKSASSLPASGRNVVVSNIDQGSLGEAVAATLETGVDVDGHNLDVSDEAAFQATAKAVNDRHGCAPIF
jgi:NAD(P)-dependent dehydrogenase (short-subunit alcohol dehydrogenase family)